MGPRSIDRGGQRTFAIRKPDIELQWGRDQLIAEGTVNDRTTLTASSLQWGRDQLIAEGSTSAPRLFERGTLQWGRDQLIAEGFDG